MNFRRSLKVSSIALLLCGTLIWSFGLAFPQAEHPFQGDDAVKELVVELTLAESGNDLDEPVALDLGLGFPLWLVPLGIDEETVPAFGAVPDSSTADQTLKAGESASFTFRISAEDAGQDIFQATPQLLDGVQISDLGRVGFSSSGNSEWVLDSYQIKVNGETFAEADGLNKSPKIVREMIEDRLAEVAIESATIQPDVEALKALVEAEFATAEDRQRLEELSGKLSELQASRERMEGQLTGMYPWLIDDKFKNDFRNEASVKSVKVTLLTEAHAGADTHNFVYFRSGGHKYRLSQFGSPLSSEFGAQEFELDLQAGPLTTADLRSFSVGMIGDTTPFGEAPDRWHPKRILVEVDGRYMYDSDESPIDRLSLKAIRLIPPAHVDEENRLVVNNPNARELFVWVAGQGAGLDLEGGGAAALPEPDDPEFPPIEPGLEPAPLPPDDGFVDGGGCFPEGFPPFPGEFGPGPGGFGPGIVGDPGAWWPPEWGPVPPWLEPILPWLVPFLPLPPGLDPPAIGEPFQVENVRTIGMWNDPSAFTVKWDVLGDESKIDHFHVAIYGVTPNSEIPVNPDEISSTDVLAGARSTELQRGPGFWDPESTFIQAVVTAVPLDPAAEPSHANSSPLIPRIKTESGIALRNMFRVNGNAFPDSVSFGDNLEEQTAVWVLGEQESHNGLLFGDAKPAWNVGVRFKPNEKLEIHFRESGPWLGIGPHRFIAHAGFLGLPDAASDIELRIRLNFQWRENEVDFHKKIDVPVINLSNPAGDPPKPLTLIDHPFDTIDITGGHPCHLRIDVEFSGTVDPTHPPALFGARLVVDDPI